jgi:hypothetical protein
MKNLFSINKTDDKDSMEFDAVPYHTASVSDEVRSKLKNAFSIVEEDTAPPPPTEEESALRKKSNACWLTCLACMVGAIGLFLVASRNGLYETMPFLHIIELIFLAGAIFFNLRARKLSRKQTRVQGERMQVDFSEASKRLEAAAAEAAAELGVPEGALSVDVFPYHYKVSGDTVLKVGKKGKFDNLAMSVFVKEEKLCFATAQELFEVPLSEITGMREYDEDFEIDMWLKTEEPTSERYKEFGLRKNGFFSHKGHGYFSLKIGGDNYEVLIPAYDFGEVKALLTKNGVSATEA